MRTRLEYLKEVINHPRLLGLKSWYILCFGIPLLKTTERSQDELNELGLLNVVTKADGLYYVDLGQDGVYHTDNKIVDFKPGQPLFDFQELIEVDPSWHPMIKEKMTTKIGCLIFNVFGLYHSFQDKVAYINDKISMGKIKSILVSRVVSDKDAKPNDITVTEMVSAMTRINYLSNLAPIISVAATQKSITRAPGIEAYKKQLLEEYKDHLNDPVKVNEMEQKLDEYDKAYLGDDPVVKNIFAKKAINGRKKMYVMFGGTLDFKTESSKKAIVSSVAEGMETSPEVFPDYMNDLRYASFSRGSSTQLGGYTYKILQRGLSSISISPNPCSTKIGLKRLISERNCSKLINRYLLVGGKSILVPDIEAAKKYIGQVVEMRSSMYCISEGDSLCYACVSHAYKELPGAVTNIASDLSGAILGMFMALMHNSQVESGYIQPSDLAT